MGRLIMERICLIVCAKIVLFSFLFNLTCDNVAEAANASKSVARKPAKASCNTCHPELYAVVPQSHPRVKGNDLTACITCHIPDISGKVKKKAFSSRIHRAHLGEKSRLDCTTCHSWIPGKSFGLIGYKGSWGSLSKDDMNLMERIFSSWANSNFLDNLHAKVGIVCNHCHGKRLPKIDDTVGKDRCLACHGPNEQLVQKTQPGEFKDRNPHNSHLGDINCTVCHHAHGESQVYCLDCHKNFKMKIRGAVDR